MSDPQEPGAGGHGHDKSDPQRRGHGTGHKFDPSRLERLRDPERLRKQSPDALWDVLTAGLEVRTLVDLGVGIGFFAIPFARRVPDGKVYGCDVNPEMLDYLREAVRQAEVGNIEPVQSEEVAVPLPDGAADALYMVNLHHELDFRDRTLAECYRLLRPGGRIAVVDWAVLETEKGPPLHVRIPPAQVRAELEAAGFRDVAEHAIMPEHYCLTATR